MRRTIHKFPEDTGGCSGQVAYNGAELATDILITV